MENNKNISNEEQMNKRSKMVIEGLSVHDLEWLIILAGSCNSKQDLKAHLKDIEDNKVNKDLYPEKELLEFTEKVIDGDYETIILSEKFKDLFGSNNHFLNNKQVNELCIEELISEYEIKFKGEVLSYLNSNQNNVFLLQCLAISILNIFIKEGWTGPETQINLVSLLPLEFSNIDLEEFNRIVLNKLSLDGEEAYILTPKPSLIWIALKLFDIILEYDNNLLLTSCWWAARCYWIRERILDNATGTTMEFLEIQMKWTLDKLPSYNLKDIELKQFNLSIQQIQEIRARYFIELGLYEHHFYNELNAVKQYKLAQSNTGLKWKLTGALGKRTKFQQNDITQLVLWAKSSSDEYHHNQQQHEQDNNNLPETLELNDDTLLENIKFSDTGNYNLNEGEDYDVINQSKLKVIDQTILLALCLNIKNSNPVTGLTREEMVPYVTRVLDNPQNWMIHTMSLILRSRLESFKSRTIERSVFQLQALVDQFNDKQEDNNNDRLIYFFNILLPSKWELEKELAEKFMSLGVIKSALEIFEKLKMYEHVIECFKLLEQKDKALKVIEDQLLINPNSSKMLCLKGDILNSTEYWYKSWEVSNQRYGRAMRSLGKYYYINQQYQLCIDSYLNALKLNPLYEKSWFICGCAAMSINNLEIALKCFKKVTNIEPDNGEAWNNLATIFIKLDKKLEALISLQQALKYNPNNWKMWTNLLYTSIDLGYFNLTIRAMNKILELRWETAKEQSIDNEILLILINTINNSEIKDYQGILANKYYKDLEKLINNIVSKIANNSELWILYSKFYSLGNKYDYNKVLDGYIKAYRNILNHPDLTISYDIFSKCTYYAIELVDAYINYGNKNVSHDSKELVCKDWKYQSKLLLRNLINRTKDSYETEPDHDLLINKLNELDE